MDPTVQGALLGAGATAFGAVVTGRLSASSSLKAVKFQIQAQRLDGLWQMRRDAYAVFLTSVEATRGALRRLEGAVLAPGAGSEGWSSAVASAREAVDEAAYEMWRQGTIFRIAVTGLEADSADSLVSVVNGVISDMDEWTTAASEQRQDVHVLRRRALHWLEALPDTLEHFMEMSKGYLQGIPDVDPPGPSLMQRWRSWLLHWRLRRMDD
ncbi:hypothetical protein [Streptomyces lydicus]|uniref:hypothetical protein n=1 Tax=Streptomyces lydicus TaxID=47763 RepID=UPI003713CA33